jgi:hypothetical protein
VSQLSDMYQCAAGPPTPEQMAVCMLLTTLRVILIKKQPGDGEHEYDC